MVVQGTYLEILHVQLAEAVVLQLVGPYVKVVPMHIPLAIIEIIGSHLTIRYVM